MSESPRVVAMMMCRNEADMVAESLASMVNWGVKRIVVQDGNSTDGTWEIVRGLRCAGVELDAYQEPPSERFREDKRQLMYNRARDNWSFDWVISVDADELYLTDPLAAIRLADDEGALAVQPFIPQFCLTLDDLRNGALVEDSSIPYRDRRRWYAWGWREMHIWKEHPDLRYYPDEERGVHRDPTMPNSADYRYLFDRRSRKCDKQGVPVQGHYPWRSVAQGVTKMRDRLGRGPHYFGSAAECWIIDEEFCELSRWDGNPAHWNRWANHQVLKGWFNEARKRAKEVS